MANLKTLLASASIMASVAIATPAFAQSTGTTAGTNVTNNVSVAFKVNNQDQTAATNSNTFKVDRYVNFVFEEANDLPLEVQPGQTARVLTFTATNNSNAPIDLNLTHEAFANGVLIRGGTAPFGTDSFNASNVKIYVDKRVAGTGANDATFQAANDTDVTSDPYVDNVAPGETVTIFIVGDIAASGLANGAFAGHKLTAIAGEVPITSAANAATPTFGGAGVKGATVTAGGTNGMSTMETVFANGWTNSIADEDAYKLVTATIAVAKTSKVLWDPVKLGTNPYAIPGAVVEYCIAVTNSGNFEATNIDVTDALPANVTYYTGTPAKGGITGGVFVNGTDCNTPGATAGSHANGTVTATGMTLPAPVSPATSVTKTVIFRTVIN